MTHSHIHSVIYKNIFWLAVSQLPRFLRTATILLAARILGEASFGIFAYVIATLGLFSMFADLGLSNLITRDAQGAPERQKMYFATSFWMKLALAVLTSFLFLSTAPYLTRIGYAGLLLPLATLLILSDNIRDFLIAYLRGHNRMDRETIVVTVLNFSIAILGIGVLFLAPSVENFFIAYVGSSIFGTAVAIFIARSPLLEIFNNFNNNIAREIIRDAWPIALIGIFGAIMANADIFILGHFRSPAEIGWYSVGQKIIQVLYLVPVLLATATFPTLAAFARDMQYLEEKNLNEKSILAILLFTLPAIVGGTILALPIILLFGHSFAPAVPAFIILLLGGLVFFPGTIITNIVLGRNQQKQSTKYIILAAAINVVLNLILIPRLGILGAALASVAAQSIYYGLAWHLVKKTGDFKVLTRIGKIGVATLVMGALTYAMNKFGLHVLYNIPLSALFYFGLLFIFKERTLQDFRILVANRRG